jgi:hypothetical protein
MLSRCQTLLAPVTAGMPNKSSSVLNLGATRASIAPPCCTLHGCSASALLLTVCFAWLAARPLPELEPPCSLSMLSPSFCTPRAHLRFAIYLNTGCIVRFQQREPTGGHTEVCGARQTDQGRGL